MISLDQALDRLVHRLSYRQAFLQGQLHELDVAPEDLEALATLDRAELAQVAERVREDLLHRRHRGSGGLLTLYPRSIAAWREARPDDGDLTELVTAFMESDAFEAYHEIPFAGAGLSLEEAFFRFAEARGIGDPAVRQDEFFTGLMKALVVSPRPNFTLPASVRRAPKGFFVIAKLAEPMLYAAVSGRFVRGPLTPFLAELLTLAELPGDVARRHGVSDAALAASLEHLAQIGLPVVHPWG